jgi:hypothetical protein
MFISLEIVWSVLCREVALRKGNPKKGGGDIYHFREGWRRYISLSTRGGVGRHGVLVWPLLGTCSQVLLSEGDDSTRVTQKANVQSA